jgi:hypothetical protein
MGSTSGKVNPRDEFAGRFYHPASNTKYEIVPASQELEMHWRQQQLVLDFFIGSRRMGRSYAFLDDGYLYQAPVGYYTTRHAWDMAPGYQADREPYLDRPITRDCLYCHASGARFAEGTSNRVLNWAELHGVSCERCHGDGEKHAKQPSRDNIVNPRRLSGLVRDSVCERCHLSGEVRLPLPGKSLENFRPGQALSDYLEVFVARTAPGAIRVNSHAEALARSRCRQAGLWCGTCHSPHQTTVSFRDKCLSCHGPDQCPSPDRNKEDCTQCHMPKARAYDGGHTVFTDHSIPRRGLSQSVSVAKPKAPQELVPYFQWALSPSVSVRNWGLAYAQTADKYNLPDLDEKAWPLLLTAARSNPRDSALYTQMAYLMQADGRVEQAVQLYRLSLAIDPNQDLAVVNLGELLYRQGNKKQARELWRRALVLNPRQPAVRAALERQ